MIKSQIWKDLTRKKEKWKCRYKYINLWGRTLWYMSIFLTRACKFSLILRQLFSKHKLWHFICIRNIIRQQQQKIFLKYSHEYWDNVLFILILLWFFFGSIVFSFVSLVKILWISIFNSFISNIRLLALEHMYLSHPCGKRYEYSIRIIYMSASK